MREVAVGAPTDGELIQLGAIQMRILEGGSTLAPHTDGPAQHRHAGHDEGFYVVSGTAGFTVGDMACDAGAGTLVMIPPGAPHTFANAGKQTVVLLNTFTPDFYVQYFRDLRDLLAGGQPLTPEATIQVMSRNATVPATDFA